MVKEFRVDPIIPKPPDQRENIEQEQPNQVQQEDHINA